MDEYIRISQKAERLVIGVMSGTSLDGVDIALLKISGSGLSIQTELLGFQTFTMSGAWRNRIQKAFTANAEELCRINYDLGAYFGTLILQFCQSVQIDPKDIDLIGLHGQTIHHVHQHSTMQLGESAVVAELTQTLVISDFRSSDIAAGGSGAPLVPYLDHLLYQDRDHNIAIQNIGGIGNVTFLPKDTKNDIIAFDTGPGNAILNELSERISEGKETFDKDGKYSSQGQLNQRVLDQLLTHDYFQKHPPKSTGRELFGKQYVETVIQSMPTVSYCDLMRTFLSLITTSISNAYTAFLPPVERVYICGGGARNPNIMTDLKRQLGEDRVSPLPKKGLIDADSKEAVAFAVFAHERLNSAPTNIPSVTGARKKTTLGKISAP